MNKEAYANGMSQTDMVGAILLQSEEKFPKDPSHVAESPSCGLSSPLCPFTGAAAAVLQSAREKAVLGLQIFCHAGKVGVTSTGVESEREGLVPPCPAPQRNKVFPYPVREKKSILLYGSPRNNISNTSTSVIRPTVKQGQLVRDVHVLKRLLCVLTSFWEPHITSMAQVPKHTSMYQCHAAEHGQILYFV